MKFSEVIDRIENGSRSKYILQISDVLKVIAYTYTMGTFPHVDFYYNDILIDEMSVRGSFNGNLDLGNHNWKELKELVPVDFITAMNSKKRVRYLGWESYVLISKVFDMLYELDAPNALNAINGKWVIED